MIKEKRLWVVMTVLIISSVTVLTVGFVTIEWMIVLGGLFLLIGAACVHTIIRLLMLRKRYVKGIV